MPWANANPSMGDAVQRLVSSSPIPYATTPFAQPSMPMPQMAPPQYQAPQQQVPDYASMMQSMLGNIQPHRSTNTEAVNNAMAPQPPMQSPQSMAPAPMAPQQQQPAAPDRSQVLLQQLNTQKMPTNYGISAGGVNYAQANQESAIRNIPKQ